MKIRALTTTKYSVQLFGYYNGEFPNVSCRFERTIASISIATSYPLGSMPGLVNRYQRVERGSDVSLHGLSSTEAGTTRKGKEN